MFDGSLALDSRDAGRSDDAVGNEAAFDRRVVEIANPRGRAPVVLVCEHASHHIPDAYENLGLPEADRLAHAVWDPGAECLARAMSGLLDAPVVLGRVSRLVHDCNRPAATHEASPEQVERIAVPGNRDLTEAEREARARAVYFPFHAAVADLIAEKGPATALVTVHSFSPTWHSEPRSNEIGLLHDADDQLARVMHKGITVSNRVELNQPYSAADGVTHTLARHADRVQASVMIEVRNDLLSAATSANDIAGALSSTLSEALTTKAFTP